MSPKTFAKDRKKQLKEKYEKIAPAYHDARYSNKKGTFDLEQTNRMTLQLLQSLGYSDLSELSILDVATGSGRNLNLLNNHSNQIIGLDYVFEMLAQAKKNLTLPCPLIQGDAEHLPFQKQKFDIILSCRFFHLIPLALKRVCLKEFSGAAKRDGIIIIEFINACYFLNPRTLLRTIFKSFVEKDYLSRKTIPLAWKLQFPFLEVQAVSGTWYPGFRTFFKWFPKTRPFLERLMLIAPFNILSERILVAFSVKQWDKAWTARGNLTLKVVGTGPRDTHSVVIKKLRSFGPKNIFQFLKDKNILKKLQDPKPNSFRVLNIRSDSLFKYTTDYEKLQALGSRDDLTHLSHELRKSILAALHEFQTRVVQFPVTWIERFDAFFITVDFIKRLLILRLEKAISSKTFFKIISISITIRMLRTDFLKTAVHGDIISGGNLSLGGTQHSEIFLLDFENVRKHEFFLYDLVHIACKNPVQKIFKTDWIQNWFRSYIPYFNVTWTEENKKKLAQLLQFCFIQALIRRLHERVKMHPTAKQDIFTTQQNLELSLDFTFLSDWLKTIFDSLGKKEPNSRL